MGDDFTHQILRLVVGRICQPLGWHAMNSNAGDVLADIMRQYILTIGRTTAAYSCHDNRSEPNLVDLSQAFNDLGVSLPELAEFVDQVQCAPLEQKVPLYPIEQNSTHIHHSDQSQTVLHKRRHDSLSSRNSSTSDDSEEEYDVIPSYLPPLPSLKDKEKEEDTESGIHPTGDNSDGEHMDTPTPTPLTPHDSTRGLPQSRPRLFSSDVSEDSGSRRSSVSEATPHREVALIRTSDGRSEVVKQGAGNVFETAFQKELTRSQAEATAGGTRLDDTQTKPFVKKPRLPPLRLLSSSSDTVLPTQQPPLSPLTIRSPSTPIRQGLPVLSPLRAGAIKVSHISPTLRAPPVLKPSPDLVRSSAKIEPPPIEAHQTTVTEMDVKKEPEQLYQVPQNPQKLPPEEFHVSTEKLPVSGICKPPSPCSSKTPLSHDFKGKSPDLSRDSTPTESPLPPKHSVKEVKGEVVLEENTTSFEPLPTSKGGVVELEEVLSRLSETESSEDEEAVNDSLEVKPEVVETLVSSPSTPSQPHTPQSHLLTPSPRPPSPSSRSLTPASHPHTPPSRPLTPGSHTNTIDQSFSLVHEESFLSPQVVSQQDTEPSEDNLSISDEGSDSEIDTKPPIEGSDSEFDTKLPIEGSDYETDTKPPVEGSDSEFEPQPPQESSSMLEVPGKDDPLDELSPSPAILSDVSDIEQKEIVEQITEIESSTVPHTGFEGDVSVFSEVIDSKDDSSEMISTLSAQVGDYSEITKVLEQELSSDDEKSEEDTVFPEGESQEGKDVSSCVLMTNTEKVKGETKGRKRTVSKEDVLGLSKPKKPRRKKGWSRAHRASIGTAPVATETPPTSLMVSINRSLYEPPSKPPTCQVTPVLPPPSPPTATSEPLLITINRRLLRQTKFRLAPPTPEDKPKKPFEMLKIRLAMFGAPSGSTLKSNPPSFEATPTSVQSMSLGSRKRTLDASPSEEGLTKKPHLETQVERTFLSSSSSSSSSENEDSDSYPSTPAPRITPSPLPHLPHSTPSLHPQTPSSEDDSSSSSSSESDSDSVSVPSGGGGLKLTISKAVLQQAGRSSVTVGGTTTSEWPSARSATQRPKKTTPAGKVKRPKQTSKKHSQVLQPPRALSHALTVTPSHLRTSSLIPAYTPPIPVGSDYICPVCGHKDDGSSMIGCDSCDDWCHWRCVGVVVAPPETEKWYCPSCIEKRKKKGKKKAKKLKR